MSKQNTQTTSRTEGCETVEKSYCIYLISITAFIDRCTYAFIISGFYTDFASGQVTGPD